MKQQFFKVKVFFELIRCAPHLILFFFHKNREIVKADVKRWMEILELPYSAPIGLLYLLSFYREFRNLFYIRVGFWKHFLKPICPQMSTLFLDTDRIGKGLYIQHGFATAIGAVHIGENCWINQEVTIGYSDKDHLPYIGDNVTINAGARVIGDIRIGNNSVIGANAVVVKDVPANCTVVGVPAYIVRRNGIKVHQKLFNKINQE